jgi:peptidoglycan hydrolase-like protein with peptidoglycan-binding domain
MISDVSEYRQRPELKFGSKGQEVKHLQWLLNNLLGLHLKVDGRFGHQTLGAVVEWQRQHKPSTWLERLFKPQERGVVGPLTWHTLYEEGMQRGRNSN